MRLRAALAVSCCLASLVVGGAAQTPTPPQATFRGGVELVQVDVSVLDKNRKPVRGLTAADFTVLEDGRPRPIMAFTPVTLPGPKAAPSARWMGEVASDVVTNSRPEEGRLVVIMMDRSIPIGVPMTTARQIALAAVDQLAPGDLAAVVYTGNFAKSGRPQSFTADRARLIEAINAPFMGDPVSKDAKDGDFAGDLPSGECWCGLCVLDAITHAADAVRDVPQRRKSLLFVGTRLQIQVPVTDICAFPLKEARTKMFNASQIANLTIHALDPTGLETLALSASSSVRATPRALPGANARVLPGATEARTAAAAENNERQNTLGVLPDLTGGRTVLGGGIESMADIFRESSAYYLIGFQRADPASTAPFHQIDVKVNRPGVDVRTRHGYFTPRSAAALDAATDAAGESPPPGLLEAMTGTLPKRDLPLGATVAAFAVPGRLEAAIVVVLNMLQPISDTRHSETVEVLTGAFDREGRTNALRTQTVVVTPRPSRQGDLHYQILSRLDLKPGRYEVRVSAGNTAAGLTGSVYTFIDVPDFAKELLSMSGLVLEATPELPSAANDALAGVAPVSPTSRRDFGRADHVAAFLRVYEGGTGFIAPVHLTTRIVDDRGRATTDISSVIDAGKFDATRALDYRFDLPVAGLPPGAYLLTVEATVGRNTITREVRFTVR